ncbi:MAG TPA: DeoR/GlpR family DNA-binding transcription regulator [Phototrophicaceae bacterium]|nr:DeoR/GlpR family DNA-binding transcription regulator [Phototrophicaceae bacterium]
MSDSLFVEERRRVIMDQLKEQGRVAVKDLSALMNVSAVTIRQDLRALEEVGLLERTYGGAVRRESTSLLPEMSFHVRLGKRRGEKEAIAAAAARLIHEGDSVALDASSTAYALVPHLKAFKRITVVTNSLITAQSFLDSPQVNVLIPGGRLRRDSISIVGRPEGLPDVNLNVGFFSARGVSLQGGASDVDADEVAIKQAMVARCVETVVLVDGSKWGQVAPYTFIKTEQVRHIITSSDAPVELVEAFRNQHIIVDVIS